MNTKIPMDTRSPGIVVLNRISAFNKQDYRTVDRFYSVRHVDLTSIRWDIIAASCLRENSVKYPANKVTDTAKEAPDTVKDPVDEIRNRETTRRTAVTGLCTGGTNESQVDT